MIPSDLASRLRMLSEARLFDTEPPVSAPTRVREIQGRLPDLVPGARFTATLQRPLPDGTFQAVVAGKTLTLALGHAASAGDTLELVVVRNTPKAVIAQLAPQAAASGEAGATLSATGRLIGMLLTGQPAPPPATLAAGRPLLDAPPTHGGAALAPVLREALKQSGLFYESHQLDWLTGKLDLATLRKEPQGQQAAGPGTRAAAGVPENAAATAARLPGAANPVNAPGTGRVEAIAGRMPGGEGEQITAPPAARVAGIPERLLPVVQQQLEGMATQHYAWQGQVWPGQTIEWEIDDAPRDGGEGDEPASSWNTTLRLELPHLGAIEARLTLSPAGVALRLIANEPPAVAALDHARERLDEALAAADLPLAGFVAERREDGNPGADAASSVMSDDRRR